jgi:xanthosine utilization system XapX-like protein
MSPDPPALWRRALVIPTMEGLWVLVAVLIPTAGAFAGRMMAIDLAYQIRAGAMMLDSHGLLEVDTFTYTVDGHPWLNQQWGAQVLLAAIYRVGGWDGIAVVRGVVLGVILALLYRTCRAAGAAPRTAALLTIAGWLVGIEILPSMRPQLFGCLLFTLCLWIVTTRNASRMRLWLIPAIVLVWANLHGSFPLAFVLIGLAWLEDHRRDQAGGRRLLLVAAAAFTVSLANPYGIRVWPYALNLLTDPVVVRQVAEWGPPSLHTPTGVLFFASLFAVVFSLTRRSESTHPIPLLTLGLFAGVGLVAIRGVVWWAIVAPVSVAAIIGDDRRASETSRPRLHLALAGAVILLTLVSVPIARGQDPASGGPAVLTLAPQHLVEAVRDAAPRGSHLFVSQLYASWVEFSARSFPVPVDPRIELFPANVWEDYFVVTEGREGWEEVLDAWNVRMMVLEPGQAAGLLQILPEHPEWRLVARDPSGYVYERS